MGKYHFVIMENASETEQKKILKEMKEALLDETAFAKNDLSSSHRMVSMLLTVYMTISTIYAMKYLHDKKDGAVERFMVSGRNRSSYMMGYFLSNLIITGSQLFVIITIWKLFDENFSLSFVTLSQITIYILFISNVYGIIITLISNSELMAGVLGSSIAVLLSILGGTFVAVDKMPFALQQISFISPMRWLIQMF